jgi:hypothetical protein
MLYPAKHYAYFGRISMGTGKARIARAGLICLNLATLPQVID